MMLQRTRDAEPNAALPLGRAGDEGIQTKQNPSSAIHIWRISLNAPPAPGADWEGVLTPEERARAARFRFAPDRARWVRTRGVVRVLLGRFAQCPPSEVPLTIGAHGKPALAPGFRPLPLHFNWSHTEDVALLALTQGGEVGVDVERIRPDFDPLMTAQSVFSPDEMACLRDAPPAQRRALFFRVWTAKEAILKALGVGFALPPAEFSVAALAHQDFAQAHGLTVRSFSLDDCHAAAAASFHKDPQICGHAWHD